jgi:predicted RNA-binding protein with PIN domain
MTHWVVDGLNVIGSRPDGWWRDRRGAMARLVGELRGLAEHGDEVTVFFDGRPFEIEHDGVDVHFATGGQNAADDALVQWLAGREDRDRLRVVTSDGRLGERVRALGAEVDGAGSFRRMLDRVERER